MMTSLGSVEATRLTLESPIKGISDEAWTGFVQAMKVQSLSAISASNELGCFGLKIRRLADLGLVKNVRTAKSPIGRVVWLGDWEAGSQDAFLASMKTQYRAFTVSMRRHLAGMDVKDVPAGMSLSGALAILHKCGPEGLKSWAKRKFVATLELFTRVNGIF